MKNIFIFVNIVTIGLFLSACSSTEVKSNPTQANASANNVRTPASNAHHLEGDAAVSFIEKHFPNADVPGSVEGPFNYTVGKKTGIAKCFYPAMGGRSEGAEVNCELKEGGKTRNLKGDAAASFIDTNFPNADIPGIVEGKYKYGGKIKKGFAKCFYPAMGGRSDGQEPTCDVEY